ncbi:addiction module toxin RelE [Candidatus Woesearchaeota archaeon]|nr:addiction module toxin RelE [Candidatus Woesearchaeota archaeon]
MTLPDSWTFQYSDGLTKKLKKLKKKNPQQFVIVMKKRDDIKEKITINPDHFKNLMHDLSDFKRVHIDAHFVLIFKVDKANKLVYFADYDHHDNIYG